MFGSSKKPKTTSLREGVRLIPLAGAHAHKQNVAWAKKRYRHSDAVGVLVPVTEGRYKGAVSVFVNGKQLGSLPHDASGDFYPLVLELNARKKHATVMLTFNPEGFVESAQGIAMRADPVLTERHGILIRSDARLWG